jgi:hypothetical protein
LARNTRGKKRAARPAEQRGATWYKTVRPEKRAIQRPAADGGWKSTSGKGLLQATSDWIDAMRHASTALEVPRVR